MIDPLSENLITLAEAARLCPRRRRGRPSHVSSIYRWSTNGCRGVRLETIQVGGTRCTSREALARFFQVLTVEATGNASADAEPSTRRADDHDQANVFCEREGL
jgi:hypothetical protein